jgi:hypothetical protein
LAASASAFGTGEEGGQASAWSAGAFLLLDVLVEY